MNRAAILLLLIVLLPSPAVSADSVAGVASVIDGDTIEIHGERIRLFGIDAPESGQHCTRDGVTYRCGKDAAFALADKIGRRVVTAFVATPTVMGAWSQLARRTVSMSANGWSSKARRSHSANIR
jgi:endonuclease YncB( thermonuclease family)